LELFEKALSQVLAVMESEVTVATGRRLVEAAGVSLTTTVMAASAEEVIRMRAIVTRPDFVGNLLSALKALSVTGYECSVSHITFVITGDDSAFPKSTPVLGLKGGATITIEASLNDLYKDAGAECLDAVWGDISDKITFGGSVDLAKVGTYTVTFDCVQPAPWKAPATQLSRVVHVKDTTKPKCELKGAATVTMEASFPYVEAGAVCADNIDGALTATESGSVDIEKQGTYKLTYTATDKSGNVASVVVRTVKVQDTLKPVIALKYGGAVIHQGAASDKGINGEANPANRYFMAEQGKSFNAWAMGAIAASVAGLALVAYTQRSVKETNLGQLV
jgi:hypothetical protein